MQGWRLNMEDAHITEPNFTANTSLFAVFDGHGGKEVAIFCGKYFAAELKKNKEFEKKNYQKALEETFMNLDDMVAHNDYKAELQSMKHDDDKLNPEICGGCTANVTLIVDKKIYCANAGDSRTVVCSDKKCIALSQDHKPEDEIETQRIKKAGGNICMGRINMG